MIDTDTIEVVNGAKRAVFSRSVDGWTPDWFYAGDVRMLRFKDHEWLAIGHVHPGTADEAERLSGGGIIFRGTARYGATAVPWSVAVLPDRQGEGFIVECDFLPAASLELLEAYATFESPYDYTGAETVTTVIGMNPVSRWEGAERRTPPIWENPAWVYSRPQAVRITVPPLVNQFLNLAKNSSLAMTIGVMDLTYQARQVESYTFKGFEAFTAATLVYVVLSLAITALVNIYNEKVLNIHKAA